MVPESVRRPAAGAGSGEREPFVFYALAPGEYGPRAAELPADCRLEYWRPGWTRLWPDGLAPIVGRFTLLVWWIFDRLGTVRDSYAICLVRRAGRVVHYSAVFRRNPRFPFMGENELQVGPVWTGEGERRRGLQRAALDSIVARAAGRAGAIWWLCRASNEASNAVAARAGFQLRGTGSRRPRWGLRLAGAFHLDHPEGPAREGDAK